MKKIIFFCLALLCSIYAHAQLPELEGLEDIGGHKIKKENGKYYAMVNQKFYPLESKELPYQGPVQTEYFVTLEDGSYFSLLAAMREEQVRQMEAEGRRVMKSKAYPETKPFIRYTSPHSGKKFRFYDVKRTPQGRIIPEEEFQSYQGNYRYIRRIDGGAFAMDTAIIRPPDAAMTKIEADRKAKFEAVIGTASPEFSLTDISGKKYSLSSLEGKVIVLNFWFIGCPPCIREMPELNQLVEKYGNNEVVFIAPATNKKEHLEKFLERREFNYNVIPEALEFAQNEFKVVLYPSHFIIDKTGIIRFAREDYNSNLVGEMDKLINSLLDN